MDGWRWPWPVPPSVRPPPSWLAARSAEVMGSISPTWYPTEKGRWWFIALAATKMKMNSIMLDYFRELPAIQGPLFQDCSPAGPFGVSRARQSCFEIERQSSGDCGHDCDRCSSTGT